MARSRRCRAEQPRQDTELSKVAQSAAGDRLSGAGGICNKRRFADLQEQLQTACDRLIDDVRQAAVPADRTIQSQNIMLAGLAGLRSGR